MARKKIACVFDGFFLFNLYQHAKNTHNKVLNCAGLVRAICKHIEIRDGCKAVVPHFLRNCFIGMSTVEPPTMVEYVTALSNARFRMSCRPLCNGKEKAIDTMVCSDTIDAAQNELFDYLVILTGDQDHVPLVQDLRDLGIEVILLTGEYKDGDDVTGCSMELKSNCSETIDIFSFLDDPQVFVNLPVSYVASTDEKFLLQVRQAVHEVMDEKSREQGREMAFALQVSVAKKLEQYGIKLGMTLSEFFAKHKDVFRVGFDGSPFRKTVSIKHAVSKKAIAI